LSTLPSAATFALTAWYTGDFSVSAMSARASARTCGQLKSAVPAGVSPSITTMPPAGMAGLPSASSSSCRSLVTT
jgi:hypothetical protein